MEAEKVTLSLGVPTVWLGLLQHCSKQGVRLDHMEATVIGGSACPEAMIREFWEKHGVFVIHAWGMTEMSPLGTVNSMSAHMASLPIEERYKLQAKQGRAAFGVELQILGPDGKKLPHDGKAFGRLWCVGLGWRAATTSMKTAAPGMTAGSIQAMSRPSTKPAPWRLSTVRRMSLNPAANRSVLSISKILAWPTQPSPNARVIGVPHPKWDERPVLLVVKKEGHDVSKTDLIAFFDGKIAKWWMPDDVIFVASLPHTATGKLLKRQLREDFRDVLMQQTVAAS